MVANTYTDAIAVLLQTPLFQGFSREEIEELISVDMMHFYEHDDEICQQGQAAEDMMIIVRGEVCILSNDYPIVRRGVSDVIGEQALIEQTVRSATMKAHGVVNVFKIPSTLVEKLLDTNPTFTRNLLKILSKKLEQATSHRSTSFSNENLLRREAKAYINEGSRLIALGTDFSTPQRREGAILFADIRSFTELSDLMSPEEIASKLTVYFDQIVEVIFEHGGKVDKFIGDAVMAIWVNNGADDDYILRSLECAQAMVKVARKLKFAHKPIKIGVGLNSGSFFAGTVGSGKKKQPTVLGPTVNLASRLESETKELNTDIVIGSSLFERLPVNMQSQFAVHENYKIKGAGSQSVYSLKVLD